MEIVYQDKDLIVSDEMMTTISEMKKIEELFIYDVTDWRFGFPLIPEEGWDINDLYKGDGYCYFFNEEDMIATTVEQPRCHLYLHVKYSK